MNTTWHLLHLKVLLATRSFHKEVFVYTGFNGLFVSVGALVASDFLAFGLVAKLSNNLFPWLSDKTSCLALAAYIYK